ncbi:MAG: DUF58 domain-containing protein [Burkholderiales bacterium]
MVGALRGYFIGWLNRRHQHEVPPVRLTQRRIYVLPTRPGVLFGSTLVVMLLGAINYNLSLGFVLVFLLSGVGIASLLHTYRCLAGLTLRPGKSGAVFAGGSGTLEMLIRNPTAVHRYSVELYLDNLGTTTVDVEPLSETTAQVSVPTQRRGVLRFKRWRITSTYPLGLTRAWGYAHLGSEIIVYPKPELSGPPPPLDAASGSEGQHGDHGQEDFAGLRRYQQGDSLKHIAWKALAHGHPLLSKQFTGGVLPELHLRWADTGAQLGTEGRLSRLCRWSMEASALGVPYELEIPGTRIPMGSGPAHDAACLQALALFESQ